MTAEVFNKLLESRIEAIKQSLVTKAAEYATDDRLHNFKSATKEFPTISGVEVKPSLVCWSYMLKHLMSIKDLADGTKQPSPSIVHEKIGDAINYLILMEALLLESFTSSN